MAPALEDPAEKRKARRGCKARLGVSWARGLAALLLLLGALELWSPTWCAWRRRPGCTWNFVDHTRRSVRGAVIGHDPVGGASPLRELEEQCELLRANDAAWGVAADARTRSGTQRSLAVPTKAERLAGQTAMVWDNFDASTWRCAGGAPDDYSSGGDPKLVCGFRAVGPRPCVVYSFGSRGEYSFEVGLLKRHSGCDVHIFDPTLDPFKLYAASSRVPDGASFHAVGIAAFDADEGEPGSTGWGATQIRPVKTLRSIMAGLQHSFVDILKIDVEGAEWPVLDLLMDDAEGSGGPGAEQSRPARLPIGHILVEVHLKPELARGRTAADTLLLHDRLERAGYRLVSKRVLASGNAACCDLAELSYVHREWLPAVGPGAAPRICPALRSALAAAVPPTLQE